MWSGPNRGFCAEKSSIFQDFFGPEYNPKIFSVKLKIFEGSNIAGSGPYDFYSLSLLGAECDWHDLLISACI